MPSLDDALDTLGLDQTADGAQIRRQYRDRLKAAHPDRGGDTTSVREVVDAYRVVMDAMGDDGLVVTVTPPPVAPEAPAPTPAGSIDDLTLDIPSDEIFLRLHDALDTLGSVTYSDATDGLLQALLSNGDGASLQLEVDVLRRRDETQLLFTLESLDDRAAPPIETVVASLVEAVRLDFGGR
ncbi:MAG: J domain-containing protein [Acidimicrobiales bacterium]